MPRGAKSASNTGSQPGTPRSQEPQVATGGGLTDLESDVDRMGDSPDVQTRTRQRARPQPISLEAEVAKSRTQLRASFGDSFFEDFDWVLDMSLYKTFCDFRKGLTMSTFDANDFRKRLWTIKEHLQVLCLMYLMCGPTASFEDRMIKRILEEQGEENAALREKLLALRTAISSIGMKLKEKKERPTKDTITGSRVLNVFPVATFMIAAQFCVNTRKWSMERYLNVFKDMKKFPNLSETLTALPTTFFSTQFWINVMKAIARKMDTVIKQTDGEKEVYAKLTGFITEDDLEAVLKGLIVAIFFDTMLTCIEAAAGGHSALDMNTPTESVEKNILDSKRYWVAGPENLEASKLIATDGKFSMDALNCSMLLGYDMSLSDLMGSEFWTVVCFSMRHVYKPPFKGFVEEPAMSGRAKSAIMAQLSELSRRARISLENPNGPDGLEDMKQPIKIKPHLREDAIPASNRDGIAKNSALISAH